jgi:hypothetical protein
MGLEVAREKFKAAPWRVLWRGFLLPQNKQKNIHFAVDD